MDINLTCRINNTSYGLVGINLLKSLVEQGSEATLWPIEDEDRLQAEPQYFDIIREALSKRRRYNVSAPSVRLSYPNDLAQHVGHGPHVGLTLFELDRLTSDQLHHIASQDIIITFSHWGKRVLEENGVTRPIGVVPCGVDRSIFNEAVKPSLRFESNTTVFIHCSKIEIRKGAVELLEAFNKAFSPTDNVVLLMVWYNRFFSKEENERWNKLYKESKMGNNIHIEPGFLETQSDVAQLYASADCGVFPSKAEGFGLGPLEMMSCGKPVILTNYSGHTEFSTLENSMQIDIDEVEPANDGFWFRSTSESEGCWAVIGDHQIDQMVTHLRCVHELKQSGNLKPNLEGIKTAQRFSWENSTKQLVDFIQKERSSSNFNKINNGNPPDSC